jgi:hypothetical protein
MHRLAALLTLAILLLSAAAFGANGQWVSVPVIQDQVRCDGTFVPVRVGYQSIWVPYGAPLPAPIGLAPIYMRCSHYPPTYFGSYRARYRPRFSFGITFGHGYHNGYRGYR